MTTLQNFPRSQLHVVWVCVSSTSIFFMKKISQIQKQIWLSLCALDACKSNHYSPKSNYWNKLRTVFAISAWSHEPISACASVRASSSARAHRVRSTYFWVNGASINSYDKNKIYVTKHDSASLIIIIMKIDNNKRNQTSSYEPWQSRPFAGTWIEWYPSRQEQMTVSGVGFVHKEFSPQPPLLTEQSRSTRTQWRPSPLCEKYPVSHSQLTTLSTIEHVLCSPHVLRPANGLGRVQRSISERRKILPHGWLTNKNASFVHTLFQCNNVKNCYFTYQCNFSHREESLWKWIQHCIDSSKGLGCSLSTESFHHNLHCWRSNG